MICKLICDWLFQNVGIIAVAYTSLYLHRNETGSLSTKKSGVDLLISSDYLGPAIAACGELVQYNQPTNE